MTLGEFREKTMHLSGDLDLMIVQTNDESLYSMAESVGKQLVTFRDEDLPKEEWADVECVVLTDEI